MRHWFLNSRAVKASIFHELLKRSCQYDAPASNSTFSSTCRYYFMCLPCLAPFIEHLAHEISRNPSKCRAAFFHTRDQARKQLETPGGAKSFPRGAPIFKLCPIVLIDVQHIFPGGAKNFIGGSPPLVTGLPGKLRCVIAL